MSDLSQYIKWFSENKDSIQKNFFPGNKHSLSNNELMKQIHSKAKMLWLDVPIVEKNKFKKFFKSNKQLKMDNEESGDEMKHDPLSIYYDLMNSKNELIDSKKKKLMNNINNNLMNSNNGNNNLMNNNSKKQIKKTIQKRKIKSSTVNVVCKPAVKTKKCDKGYVLNKKTNRCNIKRCDKGYVLNKKTNRCNIKKCEKGKFLNKRTKRCNIKK